MASTHHRRISSLRKEIDQLHKDLFKIVKRRFLLTEKIWKLKIAHAEPLYNTTRENQLIHRFDQVCTEPQIALALQKIQKLILFENKKYLNRKMEMRLKKEKRSLRKKRSTR